MGPSYRCHGRWKTNEHRLPDREGRRNPQKTLQLKHRDTEDTDHFLVADHHSVSSVPPVFCRFPQRVCHRPCCETWTAPLCVTPRSPVSTRLRADANRPYTRTVETARSTTEHERRRLCRSINCGRVAKQPDAPDLKTKNRLVTEPRTGFVVTVGDGEICAKCRRESTISRHWLPLLRLVTK